MKKFYSNQSIFAVVYLLLGIILLLHPMAVGKAVCYAMGIVALCYAHGGSMVTGKYGRWLAFFRLISLPVWCWWYLA